MPDIHIERSHDLGLAEARKVAFTWAEQAEERLDMQCTYEEGTTCDEVSFNRSGVSGTLLVTNDGFTLDAKLGFLLGAFKDRIESEIVKNLDTLLAGKPSGKAAAKGAPKAAQEPVEKAPAKASAKAPAKAPAKGPAKSAAKKAPASKKP